MNLAHAAVEKGDIDYLKANAPSIKELNEFSSTPLLTFACVGLRKSPNRLKVVEFLLEIGANPLQCRSAGHTDNTVYDMVIGNTELEPILTKYHPHVYLLKAVKVLKLTMSIDVRNYITSFLSPRQWYPAYVPRVLYTSSKFIRRPIRGLKTEAIKD